MDQILSSDWSVLGCSKTHYCNAFPKLTELRLGYSKNIVINLLRIKSIRNRFSSLTELISCLTDICSLSETKIGETFSNTLFETEGYKIFRQYRNKYSGGIMFYINKNIPCGEVSSYILQKKYLAMYRLCKSPNEN